MPIWIIRSPLTYEDLLNGKETQIEAAVKEMLKEIGGSKRNFLR